MIYTQIILDIQSDAFIDKFYRIKLSASHNLAAHQPNADVFVHSQSVINKVLFLKY